MIASASRIAWSILLLLVALATQSPAQQPPYDVFPEAEAPYYRVRYEASTQPGELVYPVNYTIWIPPSGQPLRGVIVHQHGCGEGSCKSGLTGAYDLHWQALAQQHNCALLAPSYEQPNEADCQMWCDPRNGSDATFQQCLVDLGGQSGHPELATVPWALWGHSGGGHWAGGMLLLHPERVAAAWLRSGVPLLQPNDERPTLKAHELPDAALRVPVMCNFGTQEGYTVKDGRFAGVWPANEAFFNALRAQGGLIGVAIDPLTAHECGNQRYLAIAWLDACLRARLPQAGGDPLQPMPTGDAWLAQVGGLEARPAAEFDGDPLKAIWLPNASMASAWMQYVKDTAVADTTPPNAPTNLIVRGNELSWKARADLESGLASFIIERDGQFLANLPEQGKNPFGRPVFQNLQYSDTPTQPLVAMQFTDTQAESGKQHTYRVIAVNTVGLKSSPSVNSGQTSYNPDALPLGQDYYQLREGLVNCRLKFEREKTGRVVFLGGSITAGGAWRQHTCDYLTRKFPDTKFEFINAGISSLGSVPHAFRLERDVLSHQPVDLLFLEAAVNDTSNTSEHPEHMLRGIEGVVRHMRVASPLTDIVQLHFVMPEHMTDYNGGRVPDSVAQHELAAIAYGNPSLNLSREVTDRINAGEFSWADDFKNLHPSPFGHQLYANSIGRMLDVAFSGTVSAGAKPHDLPEPLDPTSYWRGRLGDISAARVLQGFAIDQAWKPSDGKGTRSGFVDVPALVGTQPGDEFEFDFEGTGVGLFITSGPDAGRIEFSVDGGNYRTAETYTRWSANLHLPWALILDDQLTSGNHTVRVRIAGERSAQGTGNVLRVFHLLLN